MPFPTYFEITDNIIRAYAENQLAAAAVQSQYNAQLENQRLTNNMPNNIIPPELLSALNSNVFALQHLLPDEVFTSSLDAINEDVTPDQIESEAALPNQYSWVINYSPENNHYTVTRPAARMPYNDSFTDHEFSDYINLVDAQEAVLGWAKSMRDQSGLPYSVWPRKNSNYYLYLSRRMSIGVQYEYTEDTTKVTNIYPKMHALIQMAMQEGNLVNRSCKLYGVASTMRSNYKYGMGINMELKDVSDMIANYLKSKFKVSYVMAFVSRDIYPDKKLVPENEVVKVYRTSNKNDVFDLCMKQIVSDLCDTCFCCAELFIKGNLQTINRASRGIVGKICTTCLEERGWYRCTNGCSSHHHDDDGCPVYLKSPHQTIWPYSKDVLALIHKMQHLNTDKKVNGEYLRYGVELEVMPRDIVSREVAAHNCGKALTNMAILKRDASLIRNGTEGFEIVTIPATIEYHRKHLWANFFSLKLGDNLTAAKSVSSWNSGCCGIHVHITRACLTEMQLSKLLVFYHEPSNSDFLSRIAGRHVGKDAQYCFARKKKLGLNTKYNSEDHHGAIAVSRKNRSKTVEVRIFRGNATYHGIMRCLEFVDATVKWCGQGGAEDALDYRKFIAWFKQPHIKAQYPELRKYLVQLSLNGSIKYLTPRPKSAKFTALLKAGVIDVKKYSDDVVPDDLQTA